MIANIDFDNFKNLKRAVITVSVAMLTLHNIELATDRLSILGLEILVNLEQIRALFRIISAFLLSILILRLLGSSASWIYKTTQRKHKKLDKLSLEKVLAIANDIGGVRNEYDDRDYYDRYGSLEDWEQEHEIGVASRKTSRKRLLIGVAFVKILGDAIVSVGIPVSMWVAAVFYPHLLKFLVSTMTT